MKYLIILLFFLFISCSAPLFITEEQYSNIINNDNSRITDRGSYNNNNTTNNTINNNVNNSTNNTTNNSTNNNTNNINITNSELVYEGDATYYGEAFHGRKTASGETYNMYALTAAHRTLTFGTFVTVTNLANGRSVTVRINDRGPVDNDIIIDLSYEAARRINLLSRGKVKLEIHD